MARQRQLNDDLFEGTTMTFGEHLEELRGSLMKAVLALVIGFCIGLLLANRVVQWIQTPLTQALDKYYIDRAVEDFGKEVDAPLGEPMQRLIRERRAVFSEVEIEVAELMRVARLMDQEAKAAAVPAPAEKATGGTAPADASGGGAAPPPEGGPSPPAHEAGPGAPGGAGGTAGSGTPGPEDNAVDRGTPSTPTTDPASFRLIKLRTWTPINVRLIALNAQETFMIWMKAGFVTGAILASPWIFYFLWNFVASGLYKHEKYYVYIYLPVSLGLFFAGAALAFFAVFPPVLEFLFTFNKSMKIDPDPRIGEWMSFVIFLPLGFGLAFQLPLVMLFLQRIGVVETTTYLSHWRISVLAIFIISAVLTPADPISMLLMALPLTVLYGGGIAMCLWMPQGRNPFAEAYEP